MDGPSTPPYAFGDLLALARLSWLREMSGRLGEFGFTGFRRGDSAVMRLLADGPTPLGRVGTSLGVSRQAARKAVHRLEREGFVRTTRDSEDARVILVAITHLGARYAAALAEVIASLNRELAERVSRAQLESADAVLRASIIDPVLVERADVLVARPG
jgi:DNA-binding MarR family transcriptional regulator